MEGVRQVTASSEIASLYEVYEHFIPRYWQSFENFGETLYMGVWLIYSARYYFLDAAIASLKELS